VLRLLLDEHISPDVAIGLRRSNQRIVVQAMAEWEDGNFLGQDDAACLREATAQELALVTYDRRTIPPLLKARAEEGRSHAGVSFVDEKSIAPSDIGGLVWASTALAKEDRGWVWTDRICFLRR
jgi:hypothetical protein